MFGLGVAYGGSAFLKYFLFLAGLLLLTSLLIKSKKIDTLISSFENYLKNKGFNLITVEVISYLLILISYTFAVLLALLPILIFK